MRVLVACEFSGTVRDAFIKRGHEAISVDLLPCEKGPDYHYQMDVFEFLKNHDNWDLMIAHPPCTHLCVGGAVHWKKKKANGSQDEAINFFLKLKNLPIERIAIENPPGIMTNIWRKPDQYIQPYWFGHEAQKKFGLWLKNLPLLKPTKMVDRGPIYVTKAGKSRGGAWTMNLPPSADRWKIRSRTFQGIADAMADQWGVAS